MERLQDRFWSAEGRGDPLATEEHFGRPPVRCFADRPHDLATMFSAVVAAHPDREAVVVSDRRFTFREMDELAGRAAAGLAALELARGDRVALLLSNSWEFAVALIACNRLGLICVPIGIRQQKPELEYVLNDCEASVLIFESELAGNIPPRTTSVSPRHLFSVGDPQPGVPPFSSLLATAGVVPHQENAEDDVAVILYTSGTTGHPKGAMLTNLGIIHSVLSFVRCFSLTPADRAVLAIPISHVSGLVGVFLCTACAGGCTVMMQTAYKTPAFLALAARERMTYTILVPTIYTLCVNDPAIGSHDLSSWRLGCFGGAPMPEPTIQKLATHLPNLVLANSYGATETTSATALMPPGLGLDHLDSVGQIVPCGEVIIVGEDGRPQPPGTPGEIWIRGPMVVPGYWQRPDANETGFTDGYWRSGDIGLIDADGFLKIRDRLKDMINRAGYKVFSAEVENVLSGHPDVLECAVVGRPDPVLGERVHAFVVARTPVLPEVQTLRAFCLQRMADYKSPESFDISTDPLPRNNNGKMQKAVLRDRLGQAAVLERTP